MTDPIKNLADPYDLSRTSSASSFDPKRDGHSPARPPKSSERRRSSVQSDIALVTPKDSPARDSNVAGPSPSTRLRSTVGRNVAGLTVISSSPLNTVKAGSTPVSPAVGNIGLLTTENPPYLPASDSQVPSASSSHHSSRPTSPTRPPTASAIPVPFNSGSSSAHSSRHSAASDSVYSRSIPGSPSIDRREGVATFTAGVEHIHPSVGAFKLESTTGTPNTVIKDGRQKGKRSKRAASRASSSSKYSSGISSADVFGNKHNTDDEISSDALGSDASRQSKGNRNRSLSNTFLPGSGRRYSRSANAQPVDSRGATLSFIDQSGNTSLANVLHGLRRGGANRSPSAQASQQSRSSSRASHMSSSGQSDGPDGQRRKRRESLGRITHGLSSKFSRRKTSGERLEEEEQLRVLADLRMKALALVSGETESTPPSVSASAHDHRAGPPETKPTIRPLALTRNSSSSLSSIDSDIMRLRGHSEDARESDEDNPSPTNSKFPLTNVQPNNPIMQESGFLQQYMLSRTEDLASEDEEIRASHLAAADRRSTLKPHTSNHSNAAVSPSPQSDDAHGEAASLGSSRSRKTSQGLWHARNSLESKQFEALQSVSVENAGDSGTEADLESETEGNINPRHSPDLALDSFGRRRSTLKANQAGTASPTGHTKRNAAGTLGSGPPSPTLSLRNARLFNAGAPSHVPTVIEDTPQQPDIPPGSATLLERSASSDAYNTADSGAFSPPARVSSRPLTPQGGPNLSPLRLRKNPSKPEQRNDGHAPIGEQQPLYSPTKRDSGSSHHAREAASSTFTIDAEDERASGLMRELEAAVGDAISGLRSPSGARAAFEEDVTPRTSPKISPTASPSPDTQPSVHKTRRAMHRRTSSEQSITSPPRPSVLHRRTSSTDILNSFKMPSLGHRRSNSSVVAPLAQRWVSNPPVQAEAPQVADVDKMRTLLKRNKPLPRPVFLRDDLKQCRSAGERAQMYAQKINALSACESGLDLWIIQLRQAHSAVSPRPSTFSNSYRRGSDAPTVENSSSIASRSQYGHVLREDNMSEAPFPLRRGSQDVYKARDITQRAPSIAPSTMIPSTLPYPGVYTSSQTLSTVNASTASLGGSSQHSARQAPSLASAALNAAGLPSRMGFLGLGRKSSKRIGSSQRARTGESHAQMSISGPLPPPSGDLPNLVNRPNVLRPSGPRPSFSSSGSELDHTTTPYSPPAESRPSFSSLGSVVEGQPSHANAGQETLTAMSDILPQADPDTLAQYLKAANGDHLIAISRYLDDDRQNKI